MNRSAAAQTAGPSAATNFEQQGKYAEAAEVWRYLTTQNPRDAAAFASLGVDLSRLAKYSEAAVAYRTALALDPSLPGIPLNLGLAEFKQGHFPAAIPLLKAARTQLASSAQARPLLAMSYYGAGRFADAIRDLEPLVRSDPENGELRQVLAQSCLQAKNYSCAEKQFRKLLEQNPNSVAAHMLTGEALDGLRRTPEAIAEFQAAANASPSEPNVHFGLGYLYWESHQYDEAKKEFELELAVDANHSQALGYLGDIELKRGNLDGALSLLRKATIMKDDLQFAYVDLGATLMEQKQYRDAIIALKRAEQLNPSQPDAHYRLARVYRAMGNTADAQKEFSLVRELHRKANEPLASKISDAPPPLPQ
jgi:tetratricopeptide (TPR) repeat protein